ncbi:MAG: hypothetical protein ABIY90_18900 [Puia sp.]
MKLVLIILFCTPLFLTAQQKLTKKVGDSHYIYAKWLIGKWRSKDDNQWVLEFGKTQGISSYGNDTTTFMHFNYRLSSSCQLKDSSNKLPLDHTRRAYLLMSFHDNGFSDEQCNDLLSLDGQYVSWISDKNGKIFVFERIVPKKSQKKR